MMSHRHHRIILLLVLMAVALPAMASINLSVGEVEVTLQEDPFLLSFSADKTELDGSSLLPTGLLMPDSSWQLFTSVNLEQSNPAEYVYALATEGNPHAATLSISDNAGHPRLLIQSEIECLAVGYTFQAGKEEFFTGMGQRFTGLNLRGQRIPDDDQEWTVPMPFILSNSGWGWFLDTNSSWSFDVCKANDEAVSFQVRGTKLDLHLFYGPTPKQIIEQYTTVVGRSLTPPDWMFRVWKWRDMVTSDLEVYEDLSMLKTIDIPSSVYFIDSPWMTNYHDFVINEKQFPYPQIMFDTIHRAGYRLLLWIVPFINPASPNFAEAEANGYFVKNAEGETYLIDWWYPTGSPEVGIAHEREGGLIDFTNPEATRWWQEQVAGIVEMGVDGFKLDDGDLLPDDAVMFDGRSGWQTLDYPRLYHKAFRDIMTEMRGEDWVLASRSGYVGSPKYISTTWAADQDADFREGTGFPSVVLGAQSMGISGYPHWSSDTGGYKWSPTRETFARWIAFSCFSPVMQVGGKSYHEPWLYDDEIEVIYRRYAQLHTSMFDYTKQLSTEAISSGTPIMRAMFVEYPDDPMCWTRPMQYMYGHALLVAPVVSDARERDVYLPEGKWLDWWSGETVKGPQLLTDVSTPLDQIPLFVHFEERSETDLLLPMLKRQMVGLAERMAYLLEVKKKIVLVPTWNALSEGLEELQGETPALEGRVKAKELKKFRSALSGFQTLIDQEAAEGSLPWHAHLTLTERLAEMQRTIGLLLKF